MISMAKSSEKLVSSHLDLGIWASCLAAPSAGSTITFAQVSNGDHCDLEPNQKHATTKKKISFPKLSFPMVGGSSSTSTLKMQVESNQQMSNQNLVSWQFCIRDPNSKVGEVTNPTFGESSWVTAAESPGW